MTVLGIDPGSRRCGYGAVLRDGSRLRVVEVGVIEPGAAGPLASRLARLLDGLEELFQRLHVDAVAVESAFCGASARSALVLGHARGVVLAAAARAGLPVHEYAPAEVKRSFTGSGRAGKEQMLRTARTMLGVLPAHADEADALAVAVCHLGRRGPAPLLLRALARTRSGQSRAALQPSVRRFRAAR